VSNLPTGWWETTLGVVGQYLNGRGFKKAEWRESGRPIIRIQNLTGTNNAFNYFDGEPEAHYTARPGDVLVSWAATLGVFVWDGPEAVVNQHIFKVKSHINPRFHRYLLESVLGDLKRQTHGSGMVHITKSRFENTRILLPPFAEQARIVAAIEEQFSRLDAGVAALERVGRNLKRLRASALSRLLHDSDGVDWPQVEMDDVLTGGRYGTSTRCSFDGSGLPVLRIPNVQSGSISLESLKFATDPSVELTSTLVTKDDVLIIRTNGSRSLIGRAAVVPAFPQPISFASYLIQLRMNSEIVNPSYLVAALASPRLRIRIEELAATTAGQYNINLSKLRSLRIPLPPLEEQQRALSAVEDLLSLAHQMELALSRSLRMSSRMRSAILADAFAGKLVPQDPNDEPASVLLKRIAAKRVSSNGHKPVRTPQLKASNPSPDDTELHGRRMGIQLMWEDGYPKAEIAETMEISPAQVTSEITQMRRQGWDLPKRRRKATA
jgi:type I restriction enzyme S subunit